MTRSVRRTVLGSATGIGMSFAVFLWSPGAVANGCNTTPSIGQTIVCDAVGTKTITVPTGANAVEVVVIGGGGGGGSGDGSRLGGDGGAGAKVTATVTLPAGSALQVDVGSGGGAVSTGYGGGYSRIIANSTLLVLAGGGGGGGTGGGDNRGGGGNGGASGTSGAGGNGQGSPQDDLGGRGGSGGTGGLGGVDPNTSEPVGSGTGYNLASNSGGQGASPDGLTGGGGGDGFGGGGSGVTGGVSFGGGGAGGSYANPDLIVGSVIFTPASGDPGSAGLGGFGGSVGLRGTAGSDGSVTITFIIIPTPSTGSSAAAPRAISLDFTLPTGIECRFDSVEASLGSWIELPSASDCSITTRTTSSQPTLLGWATNTDFPVDTAQRQVDNGWGAYETFNNDGQLTGVFIPAGGYTLVSNDTNLYPIFSD